MCRVNKAAVPRDGGNAGPPVVGTGELLASALKAEVDDPLGQAQAMAGAGPNVVKVAQRDVVGVGDAAGAEVAYGEVRVDVRGDPHLEGILHGFTAVLGLRGGGESSANEGGGGMGGVYGGVVGRVGGGVGGCGGFGRCWVGGGFGLVLCDVLRPVVSGPEVDATINERWPDILPNLVFMTGGAFTPATAEFIGKAMTPLLPKPFQISDLAKLIEERVGTANGGESEC